MFKNMSIEELRMYYEWLLDMNEYDNPNLLDLYNNEALFYYGKKLTFLPIEAFLHMKDLCESEILMRFAEGEL